MNNLDRDAVLLVEAELLVSKVREYREEMKTIEKSDPRFAVYERAAFDLLASANRLLLIIMK